MKNNNKLIFITGGSRSGKSDYAVKLAKQIDGVVNFIATYILSAEDREMKKRITIHKNTRPKVWKTIEEGINLKEVLPKLESCNVVIIDCLTLFISNLLLSKLTPTQILQEVKKLLQVIKKIDGVIIVVSNEVGYSLVPETQLGRAFRDVVGKANQLVAKEANEVFLVVSGVPLLLKNQKK